MSKFYCPNCDFRTIRKYRLQEHMVKCKKFVMNLDLSKYEHTQVWFVNSAIRINLLRFVSPDEKINILEIGCYEGLSGCCFSDNLLNHPDSTLDLVDHFIPLDYITSKVTDATRDMFINNIEKSKSYDKTYFHQLTSDDFF